MADEKILELKKIIIDKLPEGTVLDDEKLSSLAGGLGKLMEGYADERYLARPDLAGAVPAYLAAAIDIPAAFVGPDDLENWITARLVRSRPPVIIKPPRVPGDAE